MGRVYWFTGLSGAGKTTAARSLVEALRGQGKFTIFLDGDELRDAMGAGDSYSRDERLALAMRYAKLCKMLSEQGAIVVIATISMFEEIYTWNRENLKGYLQVYLDVPIEELEKRDSKKIYQRAKSGALRNVAGIDFEVDIPKEADIHVLWDGRITPEDVSQQVLEYTGNVNN